MAMNTKEHCKFIKSFYNYQMRFFYALAVWKLPDSIKSRYRKLYNLHFQHVLVVWILILDTGYVIQIAKNITNLNEIINVFYLFATALAVFAKFSNIKRNSKRYAELVQTLHNPAFKPINEREIKIFCQSEQLSRTLRNYYGSLSFFALHLILLTKNKEGLPISIYNPIGDDKRWSFILSYCYVYVALSLICYINIAFDSLSASIMIYVRGQLVILCDRLENIGIEMNRDNFKIELQLKDCLIYYGEILKLIRMYEDLIKFPVSAQILCSVMVLVANFYAMAFLSGPGDYATFMKFASYQLCMLLQIFILCYFPSEVTAKSQDISYSLYCSHWMDFNKSNRKLVLLMMTRFDLPIRIRSINSTYSFDITAFSSIVNSSYSYFALLKRVQK